MLMMNLESRIIVFEDIGRWVFLVQTRVMTFPYYQNIFLFCIPVKTSFIKTNIFPLKLPRIFCGDLSKISFLAWITERLALFQSL